jgi:phosphoribosylformylglycinamidine synthase
MCLRKAIDNGWVRSAHDCAEGGFAAALAECCLKSRYEFLGADVDMDLRDLTVADLLFAETPSRIIISAPSQHAAEILQLAQSMQVPAEDVGEVSSDRFVVGEWIDLAPDRMQDAYFESLPTFFKTAQAAE